MEANKKITDNKEGNLFSALIFRYLPYWPLFVILAIICGLGAWAYLKVANPVYEITANILIKDEKKGADDPKALEALNIYTSKKIVENEMEVIQSKELMDGVVKKLYLYAPVFEQGKLKATSAYLSSPVTIEAQNPDNLSKQDKIPFSYDNKANEVVIGGKHYPINNWENTPFGVLKFSLNTSQKEKPLYPLYFSLVSAKQATDDIAHNLEVTTTNKLASIINLKYKDPVPLRGENILNELIHQYDQAAIDEKNTLASNTLSLIENRIKLVTKELGTIENKVQEYKSKKGVVDLSEQGKQFLNNVSDNDRKLTEVNSQLAALDQIQKYVVSKEDQIGIVPSTLGVNDPELSQLLQKLYDSEMQYEKLKKTTGGGNPVMLSLSDEIESMRPAILEHLRNQRMTLEATRNNISSTNGAYTSMLQTIPQKERELLEISRQQAIKNDVYSYLLHQREETALSYASNVSDSRVIDKAEASVTPVSPKKIIVLAAAMLLAFVLGFAYVSAKEMLNNKVLFRSEIEAATHIPIVAEITKVRGKQALIINDPKQLFVVEQFRQLRAAIGLYGKHVERKKLLITSSVSGEGKSFISTNLALSLALSGKKVVLLDMDLRNPNTSDVFDLNDQKGVAEFLEGEYEPYECIHKTDYKNLFVVPAGSASINPTELLLKGDLQKLFTYLQEVFDFIIVDTSPVDPVTDAYILSEYCDATLFVVRHNYTPKAMVQLLDENNKIKALKNLNIVFNGLKPRGFMKKGFGFGFGYGYDYVYGEKVYKTRSRKKKA